MTITRRPVHLANGAGQLLPTPWGEACVAKIDGSTTGGAFSVAELSVDSTWARQPYVHHVLDELFYVVSGSLEASVETSERPIGLGPGALLFVPRGVLRSLRGAEPDTRVLVISTPGRPAEDPTRGIELAEPPNSIPALP